MQRFLARSVLSEREFPRWKRCFSSLAEAQKEAYNGVDVADSPKIPPFDFSPPPYDGPTADEILAKRKEFLSPSMFYFYKKPLNVVAGKRQYLFDEKGRRYLDAFGGIATVSCGHCHPDVVEAIVSQTNRLQHSTILYLNRAIADFAEALASKLPGNLKVVFFTNSGTEANELAMMIARLYTGCHDIISLRNAYHGNAAGTMGATAQCNWKFNVVQESTLPLWYNSRHVFQCLSRGPVASSFLLEKCFLQYLHTTRIVISPVFGFGRGSSVKCCNVGEVHGLFPLLHSPVSSLCTEVLSTGAFSNSVGSGVHHALNPDPYRGVFGSDGEKYARDVQDLIEFGTSGHVAAFMSEAIQGVGGIVELAPGYLPAVYSSIKKAGGLCIADEVQSGFARTGSHFWGFEIQGVVPDIVTMAKGIGNGIPLGALVTTPEVGEVLTRRSYFNTFGGNPVCTAAGLAVLKVIEKEKLQENAFVVGSHLKERLTALKNKYELIGDVRGRGLMLGVELVTDRQLKTPAKTETLHVMDQMKDLGVLIGKGGYYGNVFRITPPLCFTKDDADFLVDVMDYTLGKM